MRLPRPRAQAPISGEHRHFQKGAASALSEGGRPHLVIEKPWSPRSALANYPLDHPPHATYVAGGASGYSWGAWG